MQSIITKCLGPGNVRGSRISDSEMAARAAGWAPVADWHIAFRAGSGVARALKGGEVFNEETDSLMSRPLRHADSWAEAATLDDLL